MSLTTIHIPGRNKRRNKTRGREGLAVARISWGDRLSVVRPAKQHESYKATLNWVTKQLFGITVDVETDISKTGYSYSSGA